MVSTLKFGNPGREQKRPGSQVKFQNIVSYDHKLWNLK